MVMRKHQRYFPVFAPSGGLLPAFVTVANGPVDTAAVAAGNEAVLRARFEDAAFFYNEDLKQPLEEFRWAVRAQSSGVWEGGWAGMRAGFYNEELKTAAGGVQVGVGRAG
jgi:hypothetical protein